MTVYSIAVKTYAIIGINLFNRSSATSNVLYVIRDKSDNLVVFQL